MGKKPGSIGSIGIGKEPYKALWVLFSFSVLSGNAAWLGIFLARERGEEGEWDEWGRRGNVGPLFFCTPSSLPFVPTIELSSPILLKKFQI
jgi:hypothetical protein